MKLENKETLENFVIVKNNRFPSFPYATLKGSEKNVKEVMRDLEFSEDDIILNLSVPSQNNFNKKMKEILKNKYRDKKFVLENQIK